MLQYHYQSNVMNIQVAEQTYFGVGVTVQSFMTPSMSALTTVDPKVLKRQ